jgi:hypothetical protein
MSTKETPQPEPEKEIGRAEFLNLLDEREDQLRQNILELQITLQEVYGVRQKIGDAEERDTKVRFYTVGDSLKFKSTIKPKMGFVNERNK